MQVAQLSVFDLSVAAGLMVLLALLSFMLNLGLGRQIVVSSVRMTIQLLLVGMVLKSLFQNSAFWLVVLVSMVVWGWLLGPVGALVSAPLTMVIKHALAHSEQLRWMAELLGPTRRPSSKAAAGEADSADELSRA